MVWVVGERGLNVFDFGQAFPPIETFLENHLAAARMRSQNVEELRELMHLNAAEFMLPPLSRERAWQSRPIVVTPAAASQALTATNCVPWDVHFRDAPPRCGT